MTYSEQIGGMRVVLTTARAKRSLSRAPRQVAVAYAVWRASVNEHGLAMVQRIPGYHDEPLRGRLKGLRSFRLNLGYRGYYRVVRGSVEFVSVEEVNKHDYKKVERIFGY